MADNNGDTKEIIVPGAERSSERSVRERTSTNRRPAPSSQQGSVRRKKRRKKKNYTLRIVVVLLCAILLFIISFLVARSIFSSPDYSNNDNEPIIQNEPVEKEKSSESSDAITPGVDYTNDSEEDKAQHFGMPNNSTETKQETTEALSGSESGEAAPDSAGSTVTTAPSTQDETVSVDTTPSTATGNSLVEVVEVE